MDRAVERATRSLRTIRKPGISARSASTSAVVAIHVRSVACVDDRCRSVALPARWRRSVQAQSAAARGGEPRRRAAARARGRRLGQDARHHVSHRAPARAGRPARSAICAVTFTNKAAEEMRERIARAARRQAARERAHDRHVPRARPADPAQRSARRSACRAASRSTTSRDQLGAVREAMRHDPRRRSPLRREGDPDADLAREERVHRARRVRGQSRRRLRRDHARWSIRSTRRRCASCAAFDFDDLIVEPVRLLERDEAVRERWAARFHYVMVDEFQDTNRAQLRMVQALVADAQQPVRRRRRRPVDLQLARRRSDEHPRVRSSCSRARRSSSSSRTTARRRRSSPPRTRSSRTTRSATARRCGRSSATAR